jgi:hypothetical protein
MPERGWYSLTAREEAEARGLSVDEFISSLMTQDSRGSWLTCRTRGVGRGEETRINT